jgi:hypothetical protein
MADLYRLRDTAYVTGWPTALEPAVKDRGRSAG